MYSSQVYTVHDALKNYPLILEKEGSTITSGMEKILLKPRVKLVCSLSQLLVTCYLGITPYSSYSGDSEFQKTFL
jgi:hypothetical protein